MSHFLQFANCPDSSWLQRGSGNSSYFVVHLNIYQFISNENLRLCNTQSICKMFSTCCCNVNINMQLSSCSMFSLLINTAAVTYCQQTPQAALPLLSSWMKGTFLRTRSYQVAIFFLQTTSERPEYKSRKNSSQHNRQLGVQEVQNGEHWPSGKVREEHWYR